MHHTVVGTFWLVTWDVLTVNRNLTRFSLTKTNIKLPVLWSSDSVVPFAFVMFFNLRFSTGWFVPTWFTYANIACFTKSQSNLVLQRKPFTKISLCKLNLMRVPIHLGRINPWNTAKSNHCTYTLFNFQTLYDIVLKEIAIPFAKYWTASSILREDILFTCDVAALPFKCHLVISRDISRRSTRH